MTKKWDANKKAWMINIFTKWLKALDQYFTQHEKDIILAVDNCTAYPEVLDICDLNYLSCQYMDTADGSFKREKYC